MSKPFLGLLFVLLSTCSNAFSSEMYPINLDRSLVLDKHPQNLKSYFKNFDSQKNNFEINLKYLQEKCNFLTDDDILVYKKQNLPKRKKAFKRRVKHICEYLENISFDQKKTGTHDLELIYELDLYYQSYLNRAYNQKSTVGVWDKVKMFYTTFFKHYQVSKNPKLSVEKEARNLVIPKDKKLSDLNIDQIAFLDPKESPYWQKMIKNPYQAFKKLQKDKKIKPEKKLYVIFDAPSLDGSSPKFKALDLNLDDEWSIKWGDEIHSDVVGSRLFAALGFDVDHPYIYKKEKLKVIFPPYNPINSANKLSKKIFQVYKVDIQPFIHTEGIINDKDIEKDERLKAMKGFSYVTFYKSLVEARPDRVKRLGRMAGNDAIYRREIRGALLANLWIDNWDTKDSNTLLSTVHKGKRKYHASGAFSDLGTSLGVHVNKFPADFRVGLVNQFKWDMLRTKIQNKIYPVIHFNGKVNTMLTPYKHATYSDLKWMATKIAKIDEETLKKIVDKAKWPTPIGNLYFHKLAARRQQILDAFEIENFSQIKFEYHYTELPHVKDGKLIVDIKDKQNPLGFLETYGRLRNYGQ